MKTKVAVERHYQKGYESLEDERGRDGKVHVRPALGDGGERSEVILQVLLDVLRQLLKLS